MIRQLRLWIEEFDPDVLWLSEAAAHADVLPDIEGYVTLQEKPPPHAERGDDTGDTAILMRVDHEVSKAPVAVMRKSWTVLSHNVRHRPHRYQQAIAKIRDTVWRLQSVHPPTHGFDGANREAFLETARRTRLWLLAGLTKPSVSAGDQNATVAALKKWFGRRFKVFGKGVDGAVTRNVEAGEWWELPTPVGDHDGRRYRFTAKGRG